ncbi:MHO_4530 family protein [Mycoplasma simbae]|uniref:MHO_4530 family protein n=1 Tax=Mycoplasma simbae TaxID=36744 RepID=UPI000496476E|nr:hypothetical protein [Mycoplasma simbae]
MNSEIEKVSRFTFDAVFFLAIGISAFLLIILLSAIGVILTKNKRANHKGIAVFKINAKHKWVMRSSSSSLSKTMRFDLGKQALTQQKFYTIEEFLSYFDDSTASEIDNIIKSSVVKKRFSFSGVLKHSHKHLFKHEITNKVIGFNPSAVDIKITITGKNYDESFYVMVKWINKNVSIRKKSKITTFSSINELNFNKNSKFTALICVQPHASYTATQNNEEYLNDLFSFFDLDPKKWIAIHEKGLIYLINSNIYSSCGLKFRLLKLKRTYKRIEGVVNIVGLVQSLGIGYLDTKSIINNPSSLKHFGIYLIANKLNNSLIMGKDVQTNLDKTKEDLEEFSVKLVDFEDKIHAGNYIKDIAPVYENGQKIDSMFVSLAKLPGINLDDVTTFLKLKQYEHDFELSLAKFHLNSSVLGYENIINIGENTFLNNVELLNKQYTTYILRPSIQHNFQNIEKIFDLKTDLKCKLGLYINYLDIDVLHTITRFDIDKFIISASLSQKIVSNVDTFLKLVNFVAFVKQNPNAIVIWENLPQQLNSYYFDKLNIKYTYKNRYFID